LVDILCDRARDNVNALFHAERHELRWKLRCGFGLASLTNNLSGTSNDLSATFAYNPAAQIVSTVRTGDAYAFTGYELR
jgi:hypothetical protein